ncbi:hypothetical protein [Aquabacter cavernae]|uniref:hypothetical protein n=1 Tax=Aquabacter cavernae TaxID=2496029 RepID=UPI000F8E7FC6|nr:hypothetical protein [Aquabacter cavernae]
MPRTALIASLLLAWLSIPAAAQSVLVRWAGKDGKVLSQQELTLAALDALPQASIETSTPWEDGRRHFTGPLLASIATLSGRDPSEVQVGALNDYRMSIPAEDWRHNGALFSTRIDGNVIRIKDKGPFWIMYPIDSDAKFRQAYYKARMVWQVKSLDFVVE